MIELQLTDGTETLVLPLLSPPLSIAPSEGGIDVTTLDNNVSSYVTYDKRIWSHTWPFLNESEYNAIKGFYTRQRTNWSYPLLTLSGTAYSDVINIPVRMSIGTQDIIDNCAYVENFEVTFRETRQI